MAVEFIDEVEDRGSPSRSTGVEWAEAPAPAGVEFVDDTSSPAQPGDIARRFLDPNYQPSLAEFKAYDAGRRNRTVGKRALDFAETAGGAVKGVAQMVGSAGKGLYESIKDPEKYDPLVSVAEGVARGTMRDMEMASKLLPSSWGADGVLNFDQFAELKRKKLREASLNGQPLTPQNFRQFEAAGNVPAATLSEWRKEFDDEFVPQSRYENFIAKRATALEEMQRAQSNKSVLTGEEAAFHPDVAEGVSLVASPMALVPFGKAMTPAKTLARGAAAQVLEKGGRAVEAVGETVSKVAAIPERAAGKGFEWLSGSAEAGAAAENVVKRGSVPTAVAGVAGFGVPGLTETAAVIAGGKVAGRTIKGAGEAAQAAGRATAGGPSRYGLFDRIAKDSAAPEWLRRAANTAKPLDGAVSLAGSAAKGATEGAAIGTVLGAVTDGEEGAAAGLGSGLALGAGGGLVGRIVGAGKYNESLKDSDLATWIASKSAEEVANISNLKLSRDEAVNLMDTERIAKGVGQDVEFRYVTDKQFSELFGVGKGAQVVNGDRPVVFVNTGYKGARSAFHETMHALDALEGFAPHRQKLNRVLFDQTLPDGQLVSKGIYSAADLAEFTSQYRDRLNTAAKAEFDLLTPEDRQARIMSEVRSESFANLVNGYSGGASVLASRGIKRRVADALLLSEADSMLGKMRRALESVGVKFESSGDPSELFVKNGKPITNTPAVDAALRDYVRAKDNITRKLVAGDGAEEPQLVVRPGDLLSKGNAGLVDTFKDFDIFAKNPDGSVKMMGGVPVLLSEREIRLVQSKRVDAMIDALTKVPDLGDANSVKLKPNGAWEGRTFSDKQLAAFDALPDDVLSPAMKTKLRQLNDLARQDGQQIILDYNAALKGGKYSSGIAPSTRAAVPLTFNISKAGNFYMATLDTTHFFRKLGQWRKSKPKAFDAWNGDVDAFLRDAFTYLDNHVSGRSGAVNLDSDAAAAVHKKNVINDFFNVPKGAGNEDANPVQLSQRGDKDNLIRSRRFDRINRITPGAGDKFPIRYELQKANFLPTGPVLTTKNVMPHLNDVFAVRNPNEAPWEVAAILKIAPRAGVELVNPGFENYKAFITRSPKDPKFPYQTTWFYADSVDTIPIGDKQATTYEDAVKTALNAGFTHQSLLDKQLRNRYASDYENTLGRAETGGAQRLPTQAGSEGGTGQAARPAPQGRQAESNPRTAQVNFLPAGVSPVDIHKQLRAQAEFDLAQKSPGPVNLNQWLASAYLDVLDKKLNKGSALTRTAQLQRIKAIADSTSVPEMSTAFAALLTEGQNGAKAHLERLAAMKALTQ